MAHKHRIYTTVEFKNFKVGEPMLRQIIGTARLRFPDDKLHDIIVICRGASKNAELFALKLQRDQGINVIFKVVTDDADDT